MSRSFAMLLLSLFLAGTAAHADSISWNTDASGDWGAAGNWNPAMLPGAADDVTIDRGTADPTVSHGSGTDTVASLVNEEVLVIDGGSLETGSYAGGSESSVTVDGIAVVFRSTGPTSLDGSDLFATDGGLIDLSLATSYATTGGRRTIRADANGLATTTIDLSGVTTLTGASNVNAELLIDALDGGIVDLSGVTTLVDSSIDARARGTNSVIDVSSLTSFIDTGSGLDISRLEASNGGAILLETTQPVAFDGYTIVLDGAGSTLDTSGVTSLIDSTVQAIGPGVQLDLGSVTSFDENSFIAEAGGLLAIGATSYAAGARTRTLEADGAGAAIDASSVTALTGATGVNAELRVNALAGGSVDLGSVTTLADSSFYFRSDGAGSAIDLSQVTSFVDNGSGLDISQIEAARGGSVLLDTTSALLVEGFTVLRDGATSTLDTSSLTSLADSRIEVRGLGTTLDLTSVASFDDNSFVARDGAFLQLHGASYAASSTRTIEADGTDTGMAATIDASSLTQLTGATAANRELQVKATAGGFVDLGNVSNLVDSSYLIRASGAGSVIDLSGVQSFLDTGSSLDISLLEVVDGGTVLVDASQPLSIQGYTVRVDGPTSVLDTTNLTTLFDSTVEAVGFGTSVDLSALQSFDENSFIATDGASLEMLGTGYAAGASRRTLRATGAGGGSASLLDATSWTSLSGASGPNSVLGVDAVNGGFVDLSNVTSLADNSVAFVANGAGSVVDVQGLETYLDTGGSLDISSLEARNGGTVLLSGQPTSVDGYRLVVQGASSLDATHITALANSEARAIGVDAVLDLSSIASASTNSFWADAGASLTIPDDAYEAGPRGGFFRAYGAAGPTPSQLDGSQLTTMLGATNLGADHEVTALNGGEVDLSSLASISGGGVRVSATGAASRVDLSSLSSFVDTSNSSQIRASDGGLIQLGAATTTSLSNVNVIATPDGTIQGSQVDALADSHISGGGTLDFDLLLEASMLAPGGQLPVDVITLNGDLDQAASGVIEIDIGGLLAVQFDRVDVLGTAVLAGAIAVDLIGLTPGQSDFEPQLGDSFDVLTAIGIIDAGLFASTVLPGGLIWLPDVVDIQGGQALRLTVAVPEPSTGLLLAIGMSLYFKSASRSSTMRRRSSAASVLVARVRSELGQAREG